MLKMGNAHSLVGESR